MPYNRDHDRRLLKFARQMRRDSTDAERRLWTILRDRQLAAFKFRRQHPVAGYILDYFCISRKLAIELDGGQHSDPEAVAYDQRRTEVLTGRGIRVLRFPDDEMLKFPDAVADRIYDELTRNDLSSSPGNPGEAG